MYKKKTSGWMKHLDFILIDMIYIHIALILAYAIRLGGWNLYGDTDYRNISIILTLIDFFIAIVFSSYKNVLKRGLLSELAACFRHTLLVEATLFCYLFVVQQGDSFSRITIVLFAVLYLFISYAGRMLQKLCLKNRKGGFARTNLLIITADAMLEQVIGRINENNYGGYSIAGAVVIDKNRIDESVGRVPVVADKDTAVDYICRNWIDEVLIVLPPGIVCPEGLMRSLHDMGIVIHRALTQDGFMGDTRQQVESVVSFTVVTNSLNAASGLLLGLKRLVDIIGGLVGCLITLVLCVFVGPAICIASPGPIFFSQERVGRNGKKFKVYKFRSMYPDAEERKKEFAEQNRVGDGMMFKLDWDPRIIGSKVLPDGTLKKGIGNYIRDWSLDEFPQFFNVLKGDMSLIGTRPPTLDEWEKYEPQHRSRLAMRPGITGMWQVSGRSRITDFEKVVELDLKYINEWSLKLDAIILFKTIGVVVRHDGAM